MKLNDECSTGRVMMDASPCILPDTEDLKFLEQWFKPGSEAQVATAPLLDPIREYLGRPSKRVRAELVQLSFDLASRIARQDEWTATPKKTDATDRLLLALATLVELLHAGSLAIDDIQDESSTRRGLPALHEVIGQASAINSANWLYFWPTELIRRLELAPNVELEIYRLYHSTLIEAHSGQSMDLSFDMTQTPQENVDSIARATLGLKTGALMAMCCEMGAVAASADASTRQKLAQMGRSFGVLLQMFNDLADFTPAKKQSTSLTRPSWVWAVGAQTLAPMEFFEFQKWMATGAPALGGGARVGQAVIKAATLQAHQDMDRWLMEIHETFGDAPALKRVRTLASKVVGAYAALSG